MPFNINQFKGAMNLDGARPNLFEVTIPVFNRKLVFTCKTAQLPGSTLGVVEVPYFGRMIKLAGNRTFTEWTVSVLNDEDFVVRNQIESWMADINAHERNVADKLYGLPGLGGYAFDSTVDQYGKQGNIIKSYNFVGMWPIDLSPIELSWDANDQIEEYQVTFAYQYWTSRTSDVV